MKIKESYKKNWALYLWAMPDITIYQIVSNVIYFVLIFAFEALAMFLIRSTGHMAISSGDYTFLFKTWQGPLLIFISLAILFFYVATDINIQIAYAGKLLKGQKISIIELLKESLLSIKNLFTPDGILIIIYIALIMPFVGLGVTISLTSSLYIPSFIKSVIDANPLYTGLYFLLFAVFFLIGLVNIFTLHGIIIDKLPSNKADDQSRALFRKNWRDFIKQVVLFMISIVVINVFLFLFFMFVPLLVAAIIQMDKQYNRFLFCFISILLGTIMLIFNSFVESFFLIRMTQLYYRYKGEEERFTYRRGKARAAFLVSLILVSISGSMIISYIIDTNFDDLFTNEVNVKIIAHRGGGTEAIENTVKGVEKAIELGADGTEIDIRRTIDGHYIINHDNNFSRLCSDSRKPERMTLAEIKQLEIHDPNFPNEVGEVATIEEMLDAVKGRIKLFIELKGSSADRRMVDDMVKMIKERDMIDDCVLISLKYDLIDYAENNYPEIETAYLAFVSFGDTSKLNCDYLGLEEEASSSSTIMNVHFQNKKFMVWTPNKPESQRHFLLSKVDYIITDNVSQAKQMIEELRNRSDYELLTDSIISLF
ncbi:MAG: glycerophosphoryl diester phosphodiesterase membrane domain-containing protein [Erysipelotrichaceae bacterium]|nr:glycerophosphoryl diester phosphodiesterase membrane domain-containing protein [Erysipelotrichaceae bacterium]